MNTILSQTKRTGRSGFTLVELLTVVVIISMLAGMSMLVLSGTMTAAKESKTRGTIAKLDAAILDIYESYQERFENITINDAALEAVGINMTTNPIDPINPSYVIDSSLPTAQQEMIREKIRKKIHLVAQLHFINDIMRMEMPFSWDEVQYGPIHIGTIPGLCADAPPVLTYYRYALDSIDGNPNGNPIAADANSQSPSSELLFLIIANLNPEALENFHGSEIGDIDGNGLREFHDAWGNPIHFIRLAPALVGSDLQPDVITASNFPLIGTPNDVVNKWRNPLTVIDTDWDMNTTTLTTPQKELVTAMSNTGYSDPFDPDGIINRTWFLYPLIVSGGADGIVDLNFGTDFPSATLLVPITNIWAPTRTALGLPIDMDDNGVLNHYDNIHNHRSSNSF